MKIHSVFTPTLRRRLFAKLEHPRRAALALFLLIPFALQAQQVKVLTLDQAIQLGLEQSKALKLSRSRIASSEARSKESKVAMIPTVSLNATYTRLSNNITPYALRLPTSPEPVVFNPQILNQYVNQASVTQPLFAGMKLRNAAESARFLEQASKLDYEKDRTEVILNIASAYYNLYKVDKSRQLVEENIRQLNEQISNIQNLENQGLAISNDVLRSQLQLSNIQLTQIDVNNSYNIANYNLAIMLGLPTDTQIKVDTLSLFSAKQVQSLDNYLQQALNSRKDLQATSVRKEAALKGVNIARGNSLPTVSAFGNFFYNRPTTRYAPLQPQYFNFKDTWNAGISLSYNITGAFTNKHQVADASATVLQNEAQYEQLSENIRMEVNQDYLTLQQAQEKINVARRSVEQAEENYRTTGSRYSHGVALLTDLLDANVMRLQAQINYEVARADAEIAFQRLQKSIGGANQ